MDLQRDATGPPCPRRSRRERILFGVCGGLAEYLGVDPDVVRLAFVAVELIPPLTTVAILGYLALAAIMPEEQAEEAPTKVKPRRDLTELRADAEDRVDAARGGAARSTPPARPTIAGSPGPAPPA
jgi:phage shock protein C